MKLTKQADIDKAKSTMDIFITDSRTDYENHPSYPAFAAAIASKCDAAAAKNLWKRLMEGLKEKHGSQTETKLAEFAGKAKDKDLLSTGTKELALWTCGFDMSRIAQELGFCTLESWIIKVY